MGLIFNGSTKYITVPNSPSLNPTDGITLTGNIIAGSNSNGFIIAKNFTSFTPPFFQYGLQVNPAQIMFSISIGGTYIQIYQELLASISSGDSVFFIAGWSQSTQQMWVRYSVNGGALILMIPTGGTGISGTPNAPMDSFDTVLSFGRLMNSEYSGYFYDGRIWDCRVYNRELTESEYTTIWESQGYDIIVAGLVGRWLMNEKAPGEIATGEGVILDTSGNNSNGTPYGSPIYFYTPGGNVRRQLHRLVVN
jgi:hypothetical protein